jgi:flagellar protein FliO/FliZ
MDSAGQISTPLPGLAGALGVALLSLGVVCVLAYAVLRFLARRGGGRADGPIRVVARCPLEPRRSLYLVEVAGRRLLLGVGEGPMTTLADLGERAAPGAEESASVTVTTLTDLTDGRFPAAPAPAPATTVTGSTSASSPSPTSPSADAAATDWQRRFGAVLSRVRGQRPGAGAP